MMKTGGAGGAGSFDWVKAWRERFPPGLNGFLLVLLALWTLLPVAAAVWNLYLYVIATGGAHYLPVFLIHPIRVYITLFRVLGGVTLCAVLVYAALRCRRDCGALLAREPWHFLLLGMLLWAAASTLLAEDPKLAFWGTEYRADGFLSYLFYGAVYAAAFFTTGERGRLLVLRLFTAVADLCAVIMFGQAWKLPGLNFILQSFRTGASAVFSNFNHFGYYLTVSLLFLCGLYLYDRGWKRGVWYLASFALQTDALIVNDTFGCYLAVLFALPAALLFYGRSGRKITIQALTPLALFLVISAVNYLGLVPASKIGSLNTAWNNNFSQTASDITTIISGAEGAERSGQWRMLLWTEALRYIREHPLFGVGPEGLGYSYVGFYLVDRPHNEFLQHAAFLGIPALLMYLAALLTLLAHQWKHMKEQKPCTLIAAGAVTGYLISSFFGNTMYYTTPYFFLALGFAAARENGSPLSVPEPEAEETAAPPNADEPGAEEPPPERTDAVAVEWVKAPFDPKQTE